MLATIITSLPGITAATVLAYRRGRRDGHAAGRRDGLREAARLARLAARVTIDG